MADVKPGENPLWINKVNAQVYRDYQTLIQKKIVLLLILLAVLIGAGLYGLSVGASSYSVRESWEAFWAGLWVEDTADLTVQQRIIWELRVPRVLLAVVSGAGLAFSGVIMQTILRNPLASPYTLGISAAASFGAALAIILKTGITSLFNIQWSYDFLVIGNAFVFALLCTLVIYFMTKRQSVTPETIILFGVAMMFMFSAGTSFLQYLGNPEELAGLVYWMFGSLSKATWAKLQITSIVVLIVLVIGYRWAWDFNLLMVGDESAKSTGIDVERLRLVGLILASLTTAVIISILGPIGFIGLVAPHLGRILVGGDHRYLIPVACVLGSLVLVFADTISRTVLAPVVIPVGIITSFIGAPLLIYLMLRGRKEYW